MKGQFFAWIVPNPKAPGRMDVRTGVVRDKAGADHWVLQFSTNGYKFSNVVPTKQLEGFVFFDTQSEQQAFLAELTAQAVAATGGLPPVLPPPTEPALALQTPTSEATI